MYPSSGFEQWCCQQVLAQKTLKNGIQGETVHPKLTSCLHNLTIEEKKLGWEWDRGQKLVSVPSSKVSYVLPCQHRSPPKLGILSGPKKEENYISL